MIDALKIAYYSRQLNKIPDFYDQVLTQYNDYYTKLHPDLKKLFRERVFISTKLMEFKPVRFDAVTDEMQILITSALVQITFGLAKYHLSLFKIIYVTPNKYDFGDYKSVLGHVDHLHKVIVLSWPHVQQGFIIPNDAMNVALHECAHALHGEQLSRSIFDKAFDEHEMKRWEEAGIRKVLTIRQNQNKYLSNYAGIDMFEMFAVSIEFFFEQPIEFREKLPEIYKLITDLLNQDPCLGSYPLVLAQ